MRPVPEERADAELRHHREELEAWLTERGMAPDEARAEAARRLGDVERYRREMVALAREPGPGRDGRRGGDGMASVARDVAYAVRTLRRAPAFTAVVVLTLALGIGANTAIFSVVRGVLLAPLGVEEPERLVVVRETNPDVATGSMPASVATIEDWERESPSLAALSAWYWGSVTWEGEDRPAELQAAMVSPDYFRTLGVQPMIGRPLRPDDAAPGERGTPVLISRELWEERFGADPEVLGATLRLDGNVHEVVGVMPGSHVAPGPDADVWIAEGMVSPDPTNRGLRWIETVGRLAEGATLESAEAEVRAVSARIAETYPTSARGWSAEVLPFRETVVGPVGRPLWVAFGAVGLLLLIACVNVANLLLARSAARSREMAVRTALGAGRRRIVRQLLTESAVLALAGGAVGVAVAVLGRRLILALEPGVLPRTGEIRLDAAVLAFALGASLLTGLLFGLAPAVGAARSAPAEGLREGGRGSTLGGGLALRRALVAGQLALTVMLLAGGGLLLRTFLELRNVDPGFEPEGVAAARIFLDNRRYDEPEQQRAYYEDVLQRVRALPVVSVAGLTSALPMDPVAVNFDLPFRTEDQAGVPAEELSQADLRFTSAGMFEALRYRLLDGRLLDRRDGPDGERVILVNRTMAERFWPGTSPVGRRLEMIWGGWTAYTVVGVVEDTRFYGLDQEPRPEMYVSIHQAPFTSATVVARGVPGTSATALLEPLEEAVVAVDPLQPPHEVLTVRSLVESAVARERFYATLLAAFAAVAMLLAAAGVYGVLAYWVNGRRREIGVRLALGARGSGVVGLVVRQGMAMAAVGVLVGVGGGLLATRLLSGMLFGVEPDDPVTFGAAAALLVLSALAACLVPALRAATVDPVRALRGD